VYEKLQAEIDANTQSSSAIRFADAQALPYLDACIKETFRIHPAVGFNGERVVPSPGREISGQFVPAGTIVSVSGWALHRNKDVFGEDVGVFRPERWIEDEGKAKEMWKEMFHFGAGSHICLGRNISLLELYKLVPVFVKAFEVSSAGFRGE
jgi:cytochrome P450